MLMSTPNAMLPICWSFRIKRFEPEQCMKEKYDLLKKKHIPTPTDIFTYNIITW